MAAALATHPWADARALVIVDSVDPLTFLAARNLPKVDILQQEGANVYDLLKHEFIVFTESGLAALTDRLLKE